MIFVQGEGNIHASTLQSSSFVGWAVGSRVALIAWQQIGLSHPRGSPGALLHGGCVPFLQEQENDRLCVAFTKENKFGHVGERRNKGKGRERKFFFFFLSEGLVGPSSVPWFKVLHEGEKKVFVLISSFLFFFFFFA